MTEKKAWNYDEATGKYKGKNGELYDEPFDLQRYWSNKPIHDNSDRELVDGAFDEEGNRKVGNYVKNMPEDPKDKNRNLRTGKFVKGNSGGGRQKGSRNKLTQRFLDRVAERTEDGLSAEDVLIDMFQDPEVPLDLRFKAASKVMEFTLPKSQNIEVITEETNLTKEQIDTKLKELLAAGLGIGKAEESEDEE